MHTALTDSEALKALAQDETVASGVMCALQKLFGDAWLIWEPETIWRELEHQDCEVSVGNRQQAMAGRNLLTTGRFYYDALVFDATCAAFSNEVLNLEMPESSLAAYLAWGCDEAGVICREHEETSLEFDREPVEFTAHTLFTEGFLVAPRELSFAQAALDRRYPRNAETEELRKAVYAAREELYALTKSAAASVPYPETARGVQLARLAAVEGFLVERRKVRAASGL